MLAGAGIQTAALAFGGKSPDITAVTEEYNGTAWTNTSSMSKARYGMAGAGTTTAALAFGGDGTPPGELTTTEEFNGATPATFTVGTD